MTISRRTLLKASLAGLAASGVPALSAEQKPRQDLRGEIGITTGSLMKHLTVESQAGKLRLLDLPQIMRDQLDMRVIDLMTRTLASLEPAYLDDLRRRAEKAGCILTNLKMNQAGLNIAADDEGLRRRSLDQYKRTIDAAERLGCRWVRPLPLSKRPNIKRLAAGFRELIDYAGPKGISLLIENNGWMRDDPAAIPQVVAKVGKGLAASPDTGNWSDEARYEGLAKAFPLAATCDFKAFMLGPDGAHPRYDLRRCFQIGWDAGFRGPWCLEHFNDTLPGLLGGFAKLRDWIKQWARVAKQAPR